MVLCDVSSLCIACSLLFKKKRAQGNSLQALLPQDTGTMTNFSRVPCKKQCAGDCNGQVAVCFLLLSVLKSLSHLSHSRFNKTAVRVAFQLMRQDMNKFLRRMPVIIMEDAIPHPRMLTLIWLMVAHSKGTISPLSLSLCSLTFNTNNNNNEPQSMFSLFTFLLFCSQFSGWVLTRRQVIDSLQIVFEVASCPYHDIIPKCNTTPHHTTNPLSLKVSNCL